MIPNSFAFFYLLMVFKSSTFVMPFTFLLMLFASWSIFFSLQQLS